MPRRGERAGAASRCVGVPRYSPAVSVVFQNLEAGATVDEIVEWFDIAKDQVIEILEFATRSVAAPRDP